ncbi:MAG: alcohol dehydrogenase catalytic domain-containing protein [Phycisphaerae bacterium]|nr:alcohol dehydrogenase catalytic domain-containing protein [Planctomycetota bacterium]MBL7219198.1 alcohol dehydrogenase catalytic domain-containing protein [Phycisphaerae bacterium]
MKAIVFDSDNGPHLQGDYPQPSPASGEVLVAVETIGICRTDLEILKGYMGFTGVIGHEFVGTVIGGPDEWMSRRVVAEINCNCGVCEFCTTGLGNHCPSRSVTGIAGRDGVMAQQAVVPLVNLHKLPDSLTNDRGVFAEPLAAVLRIGQQVDLDGANVVVLGDGRLGQLAARAIKGPAAALLMVGKHAGKLQLASAVGIDTRGLKEFTPDRSADVVVDATGSPEGFELALRTVRPLGTVVLKSTFAVGGGMNLAGVVIDEITVVGSRCGPFAPAIEALDTGKIEVTDLISCRFDLDHGIEALHAASDGRNIKVLIDVEQ